MMICENCKHWIPMKELEGKCVLYGLKHCVWSPAEARCDEWDGDDDTCDIDGHVMGQFEILKKCCNQWEKEKENEG